MIGLILISVVLYLSIEFLNTNYRTEYDTSLIEKTQTAISITTLSTYSCIMLIYAFFWIRHYPQHLLFPIFCLVFATLASFISAQVTMRTMCFCHPFFVQHSFLNGGKYETASKKIVFWSWCMAFCFFMIDRSYTPLFGIAYELVLTIIRFILHPIDFFVCPESYIHSVARMLERGNSDAFRASHTLSVMNL